MQINRDVLIKRRKSIPLTRGELAERVGITTEALRLIETGKTTEPLPSTIRALAEGLGIEVSAFTLPDDDQVAS